MDIFDLCVKQDITISCTWIPREENTVADYYSKVIDTDNWSIDDASFNIISAQLGQCSIDRFAYSNNTRASKFNSKYHCVGTQAVNAFTQDWSRERLNWLSPPINLVIPTIKHLKRCSGRGLLIVPHWSSNYFFPFIHDGKRFYPFVKKHIYIRCSFKSNSQSSIFNPSVQMPMIALLIEF